VSLRRVSARFLVGVGAWLLGAGAATGGSLLAVSLLGQGIVAPAPSQQLTVAAVNHALADEAAEAARSASPTPKPSPSGSPSPVPSPRLLKVRRSAPPTAAPATTAPAPQPTSTVLTSSGGSVVAQCQSGGAYLASWSPQQGYAAASVIRGPAATAQVKFSNGQRIVTMKVTCSGGVPTATTTVHHSTGGGGGDE
jgi:hypothetical protein